MRFPIVGNSLVAMVAAAAILSSLSCEKGETGPQGEQGIQGEHGAPGEQGPKGDEGKNGERGASGVQGTKGDRGETGARGATGPQGSRGEQGPIGTANVIYSEWAPVDSYAGHFGIITVPRLTQDILDRGEVSVYARGYGNMYHKLNFYSEIYFLSVFATPELGKISIYFTDDPDYPVEPDLFFTNYDFRYIIIPGGVKASMNVNLNDYQSVKAALQLLD